MESWNDVLISDHDDCNHWKYLHFSGLVFPSLFLRENTYRWLKSSSVPQSCFVQAAVSTRITLSVLWMKQKHFLNLFIWDFFFFKPAIIKSCVADLKQNTFLKSFIHYKFFFRLILVHCQLQNSRHFTKLELLNMEKKKKHVLLSLAVVKLEKSISNWFKEQHIHT